MPDLIQMGRAAVQGMMARGNAQVGDKTLLDAIVPALDKIEELCREGAKRFQIRLSSRRRGRDRGR